MQLNDLRIALFSGNYNITLDGANKALNRLVEYLTRQGATVRVYSPTVPEPAFAPQGELVSLPSFPIPGRGEYRVPLPMMGKAKADLERFDPHILHVSSPDPAAHRAVAWAREQGKPILASVHTRFETYPRYYKLGFLEPPLMAILQRFYGRCDALVAPSPSMIDELREQGMHEDISLWTRGVDRSVFDPSRRDLEWRRGLGLADDDVAVAFLGRLVMEKGLDIFAETMAQLQKRGVAHKVLVIGDGPARNWFEDQLPQGIFAGFQTGPDLGRALASADIFFNPSTTETFGNVTLEAMASGLPVVAAGATGSSSLVVNGETGRLVPPGSACAYADALTPYLTDEAVRRAHGEAGERRARDYDWDAINGAVAETYLRLVTARGR